MKRMLSVVLALTMVLSLMTGICLSVGAEEYALINEAVVTGDALPELAVGDTLPELSYAVEAGVNYTVTAAWKQEGVDVAAGTVVEDGKEYALCVIVVANDGYAFAMVTRDGDLRSVGREMTTALNGRGGGKPNFQQGRVAATRQEIENFFK